MTVDAEIARPRAGTPLVRRAGPVLLLAAIEIPVLATLFNPLSINDDDPLWLAVRQALRTGVRALPCFVAALAVVLWPRRAALVAQWRIAAAGLRWRAPFLASASLFALLCVLTVWLNAQAGPPPWGLFSFYIGANLVMTALAALAIAPASFWRDAASREWPGLLIAAGASALVAAAAWLSQSSWSALSAATFRVSAFLLTLIESEVTSNPGARILGADGFKVSIAAQCSGYEGVGMVTAFLGIFLWFFRRKLKFPNVFLLFPVGIAAIWFLNSVRIAALIFIGAHVSPEIAVGGFHSEAGWLMFLIVTLSLMWASYKTPFFSRAANDAAPSPAARKAAALLAPFLAVTAAGIFISAFSNASPALYGLKVTAGALVLFAFRRDYDFARWKGSLESAGIGFLVGAAWIATAPAAQDGALGAYLGALSPGQQTLWLAARVVGAAAIIPITEELAFRGYLHRALSARRFDEAAEAKFAWPAFVATSILFGAVHERWLAGALSGAAFAIALYRSGRIGGAITAHAVANLTIALYAIAFGAWGLLS